MKFQICAKTEADIIKSQGKLYFENWKTINNPCIDEGYELNDFLQAFFRHVPVVRTKYYNGHMMKFTNIYNTELYFVISEAIEPTECEEEKEEEEQQQVYLNFPR